MKQLTCTMATVGFLYAIVIPIIFLSCKKTDPARAPLRSNKFPVIDSISPKTGPVGTVVTVFGKNLGDNTSEIAVNGRKAAITTVSVTRFVITIPDSAGTGPVSIKTKNGSASGPIFNYIFTERFEVSTIAGTGEKAFMDGAFNIAKFNEARGMVLDASGNLFVADGGNNRIRKIILATGMVSTFAGSASAGSANNTNGVLATFRNPLGVAIDGQYNLYVADADNNMIRKISATGATSFIAGSGMRMFANGNGNLAAFAYPLGIVVDKKSNLLYVADATNFRIRTINTLWDVNSLAGGASTGAPVIDATGTAARFGYPTGVAQDTLGNLYVADYSNQRIRKVTTPLGVVSTLAGGSLTSVFNDGVGTLAGFNGPYGIALDAAGNLYVTDKLNCLIRKISMPGLKVTTIAGSPSSCTFADGDGLTKARFNTPTGIVVDAQGNLFVADTDNNRIRKLTLVKH